MPNTFLFALIAALMFGIFLLGVISALNNPEVIVHTANSIFEEIVSIF